MPVSAGAAKLPLVAIVGRPNVGKSTLFNRLTGSRRSIVGDEPGITRDRIYGEYEWAGRRYRLVDMGGIVPDDPELIPVAIFEQARVALDEADALVMVVDARTELARPDYDLARLLQRGGKPLFLAVNKVESEALAAEAENFRRLGIRNLFAVSSEHGQGFGELLDAIAEAIPERSEDAALSEDSEAEPGEEKGEKKIRTHGEFEQRETSVAIIGRPNVGKSTLLECADGDGEGDRVADCGNDARCGGRADGVRGESTAICGYGGHPAQGQDEADGGEAERGDGAAASGGRGRGAGGDRRDGRRDGERRDHRRVRARERAQRDHRREQVGTVTTGRTDGKPAADREIFERQLRGTLKYLDYAPVIFLSALEGTGPERKGMTRVLREVVSVAKERRKRVSTGQMNRFLERIDFQRAPVPMAKRMQDFLYDTGGGGSAHFCAVYRPRHQVALCLRAFSGKSDS